MYVAHDSLIISRDQYINFVLTVPDKVVSVATLLVFACKLKTL